MPSQ
ncbi:uncharacterized protein TNIN_207971, partial [Trichonephila inaurata madagascariensis]|jgi:hypothetical protein